MPSELCSLSRLFFRLLVGRLLLFIVKTKQTRKHLSSVDIKQTLAEPTLVVDVLIKLAALYGAPSASHVFHGHANVSSTSRKERSGGGGWLGRAD